MANLKKCSSCKSEIDNSYFGINRKKEPYNTCDTCRSNKQKKRDALKRTDVDFIDGSPDDTVVEDTGSTPDTEEPEPMDTRDTFWLFEQSRTSNNEHLDVAE